MFEDYTSRRILINNTLTEFWKSLTSWTENNKNIILSISLVPALTLLPTLNKNIYIYTSWSNNSHADQDFEVKHFQNIQINKSNLSLSLINFFLARQTVDRRTLASKHHSGRTATPTHNFYKHHNCQKTVTLPYREMFLECCWMNMENAHVEDTNYKVQNKYKNRRSKHFP